MAIINVTGNIQTSFLISGVLQNVPQGAGGAICTFDLRPTTPELQVEDTVNYTALGWNINDAAGVVTIIGPQGEIYRNNDYNSPDIEPGTSRFLNKTITLPLDPLQNYENILSGNYTLKVSWYNSVLDEYYNFLAVYHYGLDLPTISNTTVSGPYTGILKSTDTTEYGNDVHQVTREHRVTYPDELDPLIPDVVSSNAEIQITPIYTNEWAISITSVVEYRFADQLRVFWSGSGSFTHCVYGGCIGAMYDAIETMLATYTDELACNVITKEQYQQRLTIVNTAWHLLNEAYWSGDAEEADQQAYIIQEQVAYTGSGTCGGDTSVEVTPCPPWTGGGSGGTYDFENALTEGGGTVVWGGLLTQATTITMGSNQVLFTGNSAGDSVSVQTSTTGGHQITAGDGSTEGAVLVQNDTVELKYTDLSVGANSRVYEIGSGGLVEASDYSSSYTDRSLVAKSYVDNLLAGVETYTFSKGLTESGGDVVLGGTFDEDIDLDFSGSVYGTTFRVFIQDSYPNVSLTVGHGGISLSAQRDIDNIQIIDLDTDGAPGYWRTEYGGIDHRTYHGNGGFYNANDYSSSWTDHSLVTKKWVEDNFAVIGSGGVSTFVALTDVPNSFTGFGGYFVRVAVAEDELEFVAAAFVPSSGGTFTGQVTISTSNDRPLILRQIGAGSTPGVPEGGINYLSFQDNDGDEQGYVGIDGSGNIILNSSVTGGGILANDNLTVNGNVAVTGSMTIDTINEATANNGVTVDGVNLKDTRVYFDANTYIYKDGSDSMTFVDVNAGTVTLSQFASSSGSAITIDAGGRVDLGGTADDDIVIDLDTHGFQMYGGVSGTTGIWIQYDDEEMWVRHTDSIMKMQSNGVDFQVPTDGTILQARRSTTYGHGLSQTTIQGNVYLIDITSEPGTDPNEAGHLANIGGDPFWFDGSDWIDLSAAVPVANDTKQSGTDAGVAGELAYDDDYLYICTTGGAAGVAVWKRVALAIT
jgi:hypothetical protein